MSNKLDSLVVGNGCFWCTEALFKRLNGVVSVQPGYMGGTIPHPTDDDIYSGKSGHAEAILITYDPAVIKYEDLLDIFWHTHDPTTLNRQGYDRGTQYRSVIFTNNQQQTKIATKMRDELSKSGEFADPIVTEITPRGEFCSAAEYHHNFYENQPFSPYCTFIIRPKIKKLLEKYGKQVKAEYK